MINDHHKLKSPVHQPVSTTIPITQSDRQDVCIPATNNRSCNAAAAKASAANQPLKRRVSESSASVDESSTSSSARKRHATCNNTESSRFFYQPPQTRDLPSCFRIRKHMGEGTFGSVFLTIDRATQELKIIKRVKTRDDKSVDKYGFPYTALREIKILKPMDHCNVIKLFEVVTTEDSNGLPEHIFMVLEYMEYDLAAMLRLPELSCRLTIDHVQSWTRQLLCGCEHLHAQQILHRDLKPANLLINKQGTLKIGDFGLALKLETAAAPHRKHTTSIGTPWYRAPEILVGSCGYDTKVDMWSTGCILYELGCRNYTAQPLFHASTGIDLCKQIDKIFASIKENETWLAKEIVRARMDPVLKDDIMLAKLISKLLQICPKQRQSAEDALKDDFLANHHYQHQVILNMNFPRSSGHELDVMKFRQQQQQQQR